MIKTSDRGHTKRESGGRTGCTALGRRIDRGRRSGGCERSKPKRKMDKQETVVANGKHTHTDRQTEQRE